MSKARQGKGRAELSHGLSGEQDRHVALVASSIGTEKDRGALPTMGSLGMS